MKGLENRIQVVNGHHIDKVAEQMDINVIVRMVFMVGNAN